MYVRGEPMKQSIRRERYGYLFIAPFFIVFALFSLYPLLYTLYLSFTQWGGFEAATFVGIKNYIELIHDSVFFTSLGNTLFIWIVAVIPQLGISLIVAVLLNQRFIRGKHFFRTVFFLPNVTTAASLGLLVGFLFSWQSGAINHILVNFHIIGQPINWLQSPFLARLLNSGVAFWEYWGYTLVIWIAGLQSIPDELIEAVRVDGGNELQAFWHITLPMLRPIAVFQIITSLIGGLQNFDVPFTLTDGLGGPQNSTLTSVLYLYLTGFRNYRFGYAAAISYGLFIVTVLFSIIAWRATAQREAKVSR